MTTVQSLILAVSKAKKLKFLTVIGFLICFRTPHSKGITHRCKSKSRDNGIKIQLISAISQDRFLLLEHSN